MKKVIAFVLFICVSVAAGFGLGHLTGNNKSTAETNQENIIEVVSVTTPVEETSTIEPEVTEEPTIEPEVTEVPVIQPVVVEAPATESEAIEASTVEPEVTETPVAEATMYVMTDMETGKIFYRSQSQELVLQRIRENITAEEAVNAVECVNYGAMMVVSHNDKRIIEGFSAYDLISDEKVLQVTFNRNSNKLYVVCDEKEFEPSEMTDKTFKGFADRKAYSTWICTKHDAFKASNLLFEGYPKSEGYRGPFAVVDGFDAKVLKSIVLINTEDNRYDWVLVSCDCNDVVKQKPSGGNGGGSKPNPDPTPTPEPENNSRPSANPTMKPTPEPENNSRPSANPTAKPTQAPVTEPDNNNRPNTGSGAPSTESNGSTAGESSGRPNTGSSSSSSGGSGRPNVGGNTGSGSASSDADPFA